MTTHDSYFSKWAAMRQHVDDATAAATETATWESRVAALRHRLLRSAVRARKLGKQVQALRQERDAALARGPALARAVASESSRLQRREERIAELEQVCGPVVFLAAAHGHAHALSHFPQTVSSLQSQLREAQADAARTSRSLQSQLSAAQHREQSLQSQVLESSAQLRQLRQAATTSAADAGVSRHARLTRVSRPHTHSLCSLPNPRHDSIPRAATYGAETQGGHR